MTEAIRFFRTYRLVGVFLAACFAGQIAQASTVIVGTCKSGTHFSTIQAAVNAAGSKATIDVCPGTYPEQVTITKTLTLIGIQSGTSGAAVIVPPSGGLVQNAVDLFGNPVAAQIFVANATGVSVKSLTIDGTGNNIAGCTAPRLEGIYYQSSSGSIYNNVVRNQFQTDFADDGLCQNGLAINVESLTNSAVTISNNTVRAYQKNGITATGAATGTGAPGPVVSITGNNIVGMGATAMNWQTPGAAENGIQVGFGATGQILGNTVNDNIWGPDTIDDTGDAASGIIIFASQKFTLMHNNVGSAQFGIVAITDTVDGYGTADGTTVQSNNVAGTQLFDGIDMCSSSNVVTLNTISGSAESAVHLDDSCGSGNSNKITQNVINEACAGILLGTGTGNTVSPNTLYNVTKTTLAGDTCSPSYGPGARAAGSSKKQQTLRPSPYNPTRR